MSERAASAQHIDQIFSGYPEWNRTPYRLSLDGKSGVDHTNPASWTGDVTVKNVNFYDCWVRGRSQAAELLKSAGVPFEFDPAILSTGPLEIDLMRPHGMYPGVQADSIEPDTTPAPLSELTDSLNNATEPASDAPGGTSCPTAATITGNSTEELADELADDELAIEHLLPPTPESEEFYSEPTSKKGWIFIDDKPIHLESAIRYLLGSDAGAKSTDRLRRVRGFTRFLQPSATPADSVIGDDFHVADLAASLLLVDNKIAVVINRVTSIIASDGRLLESISENHFSEPGITLSGQALTLAHNSDSEIWYWTKDYDLITASTTSAHRKRGTGFDIIARLCCPVNPQLVERDEDHVRALKQEDLTNLMNQIRDVCASNKLEKYIPVCKGSLTFPYQTANGLTPLCHEGGTQSIQQALRPMQGTCRFCNEQVDIKQKMRVHIGRHLLSLRSGQDYNNIQSTAIAKLCGFCGNEGPCRTWVERQAKSTKSLQVVSHCSYHDHFSYNAASSSSKSNPCTNRPVQCPRCPSGDGYIWSYCLRDHLLLAHGPKAIQELSKQIEGYDPSDNEYLFMGVDPKSGSILTKPTKNRKRPRETDAPNSTAGEPSSNRQRHT